jgi:hypothetical protein
LPANDRWQSGFSRGVYYDCGGEATEELGPLNFENLRDGITDFHDKKPPENCIQIDFTTGKSEISFFCTHGRWLNPALVAKMMNCRCLC